jgi:D-3-phosphoglycerate dehydrogenase / 2-oxoglutarate reductase
MAKYKVLIADSRHPAYEEEKAVLSRIDAEIIINRSDNEQKIAHLIIDCDGLIVNLAPITAKIISNMNKCKCVSRYGVGYDNIDTKALKEKGIFLANVPDYCVEDVSDHALALFLDGVRKIARKDRLIKKGKWNLIAIQPAYRIANKTFGFIGYGAIARCLHRKISALGLKRVIIADPYVAAEEAKKACVESADLNTLCKEADFISIHAPLTPQTKNLIDTEQFNLMKSTAILINTSRGPLINTPALIEALKNNKIACVGLDVFDTEPLEAESELRKLENVTLSDHNAWYTAESMSELKTKAAENILDTLTKGSPKYIVRI